MHLQHLIPWSDLVYCLRVDPTEISLPIGVCGRIHIINKATQIKVSMRNFITDEDVCTIKDCRTTDELKVFSKNKLSAPLITTKLQRRQTKEAKNKLNYFIDKFYKTILEFIDGEDRKHSDDVIKKFKPAAPAAIDQNICCTECYSQPCRFNCKLFIFWSLLFNNQIDHILWLDKKKEIRVAEAIGQNYGGQAVGNGYNFLILYHLLPFYVLSNVIIACGYESDPEKWGSFSPTHYYSLINNIKEDCDFKTFIPSLRPLLDEKIFMRDMTKTKELLREVFRHIYVYFYLKKKFQTSDEDVLSEIKRVLRYYLDFKDLQWWK